MKNRHIVALLFLVTITTTVAVINGCKPQNPTKAVVGDAAQKVYVAPGQYDEFYNFVSGGFSGQVSVYGLPSGRMLRHIPVFSQDPQTGWGYSEETKPMLMTSHGFIPWDDSRRLDFQPPMANTTGAGASSTVITRRVSRVST